MGKLARIALWVMLLLPALLHAQQVVQTPNIGLQTPAYGAEYWNVPLNYNFTQLDLYLSGNLALPGLSVTGYASMPGLTTWNKNTSYSINNVVSYQGTFYASLVNGNQGNTPSNGSYWSSSVGSSTPPGGANQDVQFNNSGVFGGNSSLTFNPSTAALTIGPAGTTAGSYSGPLQQQALYNTGTGLALDTYSQYIQIGSGVNPYSQMVFNHPSGTPGGGQYYFVPPVQFGTSIEVQGPVNLPDLTPSTSVCTDGSSNLTTSGCGGSGGGGLTPKNFGGYGDALQIPNGCTTTVSSASVTCAGADFGSGDIGKELWVSGAGAAGVAYGAAITAVTSSTVVTLASTASTAVTAAAAVYGHDDVVAIQDCINASSLDGTQCVMGTATPNLFLTGAGYLVASAGLQIPTHANFTGSSYYGGTTILSEYNGDLISLTTGTSSLYAGQPVSGVTMSNLDLVGDPSQPNGRGIHVNSAAGLYGFGGMYYGTFNSISTQNFALESLWLDGHTNSTDNPNQYLTFNNFVCNGPNQSHPANLIKITGIQAQILFQNGACNGSSQADYPNPMIYVGEKSTGQSDSPGAVTFFGFTYEVGTQGLYIGEGSTSIHFDNGYVEQVGTPLIVQGGVNGLTFRGNNLANSGNVTAIFDFIGGSSPINGSVQDNREWGGTAPAAFAVCSGGTNNFNVDFLNNESTITTSSNCATNHSGTGAALFQATGTTATVDPSSQVINLIEDLNVQPGKTLTLYALGTGAPNSFSLASGGTATGNEFPINLGALSSPLVVTAGNTVILALLDQSATFTGTGSGTNLTTSAVAGYIVPGSTISGTGVPGGTTIVSQTSGTVGGAGVYVTSAATTSSGATITSGSFTYTVVGGTAVAGTGTVNSIGVTTANGVSGTSSGGATPSLTLSLGAITPSSVIASGIVDGQAPVTITTGSTATLGGTYSSGYTVNHEGTAATAVTYTLPTAAAGKQYCVKNGYNGSAADTGVLTLQTSAAGQSIVYNGTAGASDGYLVSGGAAGDAACVVGISSTTWEAYVQVGSWVVH